MVFLNSNPNIPATCFETFTDSTPLLEVMIRSLHSLCLTLCLSLSIASQFHVLNHPIFFPPPTGSWSLTVWMYFQLHCAIPCLVLLNFFYVTWRMHTHVHVAFLTLSPETLLQLFSLNQFLCLICEWLVRLYSWKMITVNRVEGENTIHYCKNPNKK